LTSERSRRAGGFTLIEALVALTVVLAFATTIVPFLSQARGIVAFADRRVAAHVLLRSLVAAPYGRSGAPNVREGETSGLRWRIVAEPITLDVLPAMKGAAWIPVRITATVAWGPGRSVSAETIRLGRPE
jgi:type II secretory pathway pseudopilin PulG